MDSCTWAAESGTWLGTLRVTHKPRGARVRFLSPHLWHSVASTASLFRGTFLGGASSKLLWSAMAVGRAVTATVTAVPSGPTALRSGTRGVAVAPGSAPPPQTTTYRSGPYTVPGPRYELASTAPFFISSMSLAPAACRRGGLKKVVSPLGVETIAPAAHPQVGSISVLSPTCPSPLRWVVPP